MSDTVLFVRIFIPLIKFIFKICFFILLIIKNNNIINKLLQYIIC